MTLRDRLKDHRNVVEGLQKPLEELMGSQGSVRATALVSIVHDDLQSGDLLLREVDLGSDLLCLA